MKIPDDPPLATQTPPRGGEPVFSEFRFFYMIFYVIITYKEMRKISLYLFAGLFCTANAFAADTTISRIIPTKNNTNTTDQRVESVAKNRSARVDSHAGTISRSVSRNMPVSNFDIQKTNVVSRSVTSRGKSTTARATLSDAVNTVGRSARTEASSINSNPAVRRAGIKLRASTAEVGGRAIIGDTGIQTGSNIDEQVRGIKSRASIFGNKQQKTVTAESLATAKDILEKTSDLNNTCQAQYNECMDQFCAVVDANQKRCSCSANLDRYAKAQKAVEDANVELNDVAQRIRYVGLSADEIRAIMSATEAELEMGKTKDNTQTRSMLDDIADMIKDPTSSTTLTSSNTMDSLLDVDLDFSSDSSDMFSLEMFNSNNDISSKRGKALYNEAKKRCKAVISRCKDAGGTEDQISGNYDLAIDKDCIAYEQGLNKLNETLKNNVRSANLMLQKARLAVLQNKNQYDIKGCVGALETCMLDDMVCGENYVKCLDPTKKFIDENGNVVLGQNIAKISEFMSEYNNAKIDEEFIKNSNGNTGCSTNDGACVVNYLMQKIGMGATFKDGGLCRSVLDRCQDYTYSSNGKTSTYMPYNDVVINYIQRAMVNIKASQSQIISDYASTCMADVRDCYNQQNTQIASMTTSASIENVYRVMTGACYNVALTCGYAIFAYDPKGTDSEYIEGISEIFYQSLLCPDNSHFVSDSQSTIGTMVNDRCACNDGYFVSGSSCVANCPVGMVAVNNKCQVWTEPTETCNTSKFSFFEAIFYNGQWRPKNCVCPSDKPFFSLSYNYAPVGQAGRCVTRTDNTLTDSYCQHSERITGETVNGAKYNSQTHSCDCPTGTVLLEERCRLISGPPIWVGQQIPACYATGCARSVSPSDVYPLTDTCEDKQINVGNETWTCEVEGGANLILGLQKNCEYNPKTHKVDCK